MMPKLGAEKINSGEKQLKQNEIKIQKYYFHIQGVPWWFDLCDFSQDNKDN